MKKTIISVAIPCYKSAKSIGLVVNELRKTISSRDGYDYQIILVNDYPYDNTFAVISELCHNDSKIIGINLSRNYGQAYAKMAALEFFDGDVLVFMDDDGQHPANEIFKLVDKVQKGYDVVYAKFSHKKHTLLKRFTSLLYRKLQTWSGSYPKGVFISPYFAVSAFVGNELRKYKSPYPSVGGYMQCITQKYADVEVTHKERIAGKSNYTFGKLLGLCIMLFFNYSMLPLRIASYTGALCAVAGFLYGLWLIIQHLFFGPMLLGYTSTMALMLFIGGLIMLMLGIIGEYLGRIYMTISDKPQYVVREVINGQTD